MLISRVCPYLTLPSLALVFGRLTYLRDIVDAQAADLGWRQQAVCPTLYASMDFREFWHKIFRAKNLAGTATYTNLCKVVAVLLLFLIQMRQ